jgi:hypothetical protein
MHIWPFTEVNRAKITPELRSELEQFGEPVVAQILGRPYTHAFPGNPGAVRWEQTVEERQAALAWLREKHNEETRRHNITMAMEIAITLLVAVEALPRLASWCRAFYQWFAGIF